MAANDVMREVIRQMREASITSDIDWEPRLSGWAEQLESALSRPDGGEVAVAWIRHCSDGTYEGPIHDSRMDELRRKSGAWTPLYTRPAPPAVVEGKKDE